MALNVATLVARVIAETSGFNAGMAQVEGRMGAAAASMRRTGSTLTHSLTLPLVIAAAASVKFANDYQAQMTLIHTQAGASTAEVDKMTKAVMKLAPATAFGPVELSKALYHIESVGDRGAKALTVLQVAAEGAAVGHAHLEDTASALVGLLRVYHIQATGAAGAMGNLNAVVGAGNMRMQDMVNAIATGLFPTTQGLGISFRETGAALATMTDETVPAQVAATRLRTLFLLMSGETKKSVDTLKQLGIGQLDLAHAMARPGGMINALDLLHTKLNAFSKDPAVQTQMLAKAFGGARSSGTIIQLLNNLEMVRQKLTQINKTAGDFPQAVIATQATNTYKLHQAWAAIQTAMITFGGVLTPFINRIAEFVAKLAMAFQNLSPHMQSIIVYGSMIVAALGPLLWILGTLYSAIDLIVGVIEVLSGPVGLVVAAIAALAAAFYEMYTHSAKLRAALSDLFSALKTDGLLVFNALKNLVSSFNTVLGMNSGTWKRWGDELARALEVVKNGVNVASQYVADHLNRMAAFIRENHARIRSDIQQGWNAIRAVFQTVNPVLEAIVRNTWNHLKDIVQTDIQIIKGIVNIVMGAIRGDWGRVWQGIVQLTGAVMHSVVQSITTPLKAAATVVSFLAAQIGHAIWAGIQMGLAALGQLFGYLWGQISAAISGVATAAWGLAVSIGSAIAQGVLAGVGNLAGELASKVGGAVTGALGSVAGHLGIHSPSTVTRDKIGKPLGQGVVQGYLLGVADLPTKMDEHLRKTLEHAKQVIDAKKEVLRTAFQRLSDYIMQAFDAKTQQHLDKMQKQFDAKIKKLVTDPLEKAMKALDKAHQATLDKIDAQGAALTPTEALIAQMQDAHAEAQRQQAITDARKALADAKVSGDPQAVLSAQQQLNDALYEETIASLSKQADAERVSQDLRTKQLQDAENDRYDAQQTALQARFDKLKEKLQAEYDQQVLNYQSERDLQRQHLEDELADLEKYLEKHPEAWKKVHGVLMKLFHDQYPSYKAAGKALGTGFAKGLREADADVAAAAKHLADTAAAFLKLKSPSERGPMSDLDTWWSPMARTLVSGLRPEDLEGGLDSMVPSATAAARLNIGANLGGGATKVVQVNVSLPGLTLLSGDQRAARDLTALLIPHIEREISI